MRGDGEPEAEGGAESIGLIIAIMFVATIGGFLFGFDSGVINGTIDGLSLAFGSSAVGTGFNVASMLLGCAVGAFAAGWLADRIGRRSVLLIAAVFFIISAWGSGIAGGSLEFVLYRVLGGLSVGAASVLSPAYIAEISPARLRGRLVSVQQIMIITGLASAFLSNYLLAGVTGGSTAIFWMGFETWRWMFWVEIIPATLFLLALIAIPESPRYLVAKGRTQAALAVLSRLLGAAAAARKITEIRQSLSGEQKPRFSDLIDRNSRRIRPILWVGIGLAVFQQLVGINVVFYYGAVLWQAVGFSEGDALLINAISGGTSIAACFIAFALVDRIGRKPLLFFGSVGMTVSLGVMAAAFATGGFTGGNLALSDQAGLVALISANLYTIIFNFSWGPVMWIMLGEMFPNAIRGSALAVTGFAQWIANFGITITFPVMLAGIGLSGAYGFYALCALASTVFVARLVYETRGIELEDMKG
jgi:SP family sugar:H+ symporter-like MFS transporter